MQTGNTYTTVPDSEWEVRTTHADIFETAFEFALSEEGGYVNDRYDPGGQTKFGISKAAHPNEDIPNLTLERAKAIYFKEYWNPIKSIAEFNPMLAVALFDTAVNMGVGTATRLLQKAVHVPEDGKIGPVTRAAIETYSKEVIPALLRNRIIYYTERPHWDRFKNGWVIRVIRLAQLTGGYNGRS